MLPSDAHVDRAMTAFSLRYSNDSYIADQVFPVVPVEKDSDLYFTYGKENMRLANAGPLGARTPAPEATYTATTASYKLDRYGLADIVLDDLRDNADDPLRPDEDCTATLTDLLLLQREKACADIAFSTTHMTQNTTLSGTSQWSDYAGSDPLGDIETGKSTVHSNCFREANFVTMGIQVWRKVRHHPTVVERFKYVAGGGISRQQFADLIEIPAENIHIGSAAHVSSNEGQATDTTAYIWGKHFLIGYRAPGRPTIKSVSLGLTLQRGQSRRVTTWRNNNPRGDWKMVEDYLVHKVVAATAGYLIVDAVA
jgi:hypothetical protein